MARGRSMGQRTTSKTVTFALPFLLKGVDRVLPAGDYRVVTDEELMEGLSFPPARVDHDFSADRISSSSRDAHGRSSRSSGCTGSRRSGAPNCGGRPAQKCTGQVVLRSERF